MPAELLELDFKIAKAQDADIVIRFLRKFFYRDEPLNKYLGLVTREKPFNKDAESYSMINFDRGLALLALEKGKLIGVCLSDVIHRNGQDPQPRIEDKRFAKLIGLFNHLTRESRIFDKFRDCDKGIEVNVLSVDGSYRGQGIAKRMLRRIRELGRERNCDFIKMDCTSSYSASAAESLGFDLIYSLNYSDYLVNNEVVFRPDPPHSAATVYAQYIDRYN